MVNLCNFANDTFLYVLRYSWSKSFLDMLKEPHDLAGQHEVTAENISGRFV